MAIIQLGGNDLCISLVNGCLEFILEVNFDHISECHVSVIFFSKILVYYIKIMHLHEKVFSLFPLWEKKTSQSEKSSKLTIVSKISLKNSRLNPILK